MPSPLIPEVAARWARRLDNHIVLGDAGCVSVMQRPKWWEALTYAEFCADHRTVARAIAYARSLVPDSVDYTKHDKWLRFHLACDYAWRDSETKPTAALVELDRVLVGIENTEEQT